MSGNDRKEGGRVPVGEPLYLAEARYLREELKKLGISSKVRNDPDLGSRREASHRVLVRESDREAALSARIEILEEHDEGGQPGSRPASSSRGGRSKGPLVLGILGAVAGARVGTHIHGSAALTLLLTVVFGLVSFGLGRLLWAGERATATLPTDDDGSLAAGERHSQDDTEARPLPGCQEPDGRFDTDSLSGPEH